MAPEEVIIVNSVSGRHDRFDFNGETTREEDRR